MSKRFLICALFLYTSLEALQIPTGHNSAYFDVQIDRVEQIFADEKYTDWTGVKVKKLNKTRSVIGDVIIYQPLGDEIIVEGRGFMKQGGEYRQMPYRFPQTPMCQFYANDAYVYPELADKSDFPKTLEGNCPLKAGTYKIYGFSLDLDKLPKVIAPSGDYAGEVTWFKENKMIFKFRIYGTIVNV